MKYEIKDSRFPFCVDSVIQEDNIFTVNLKGSALLAEHLYLINTLMFDKSLFLYSIDFDTLTQKIKLTYW